MGLDNKATKTIAPEDAATTKRASIALRTQLQGLLQSSVLTRSKVGRHGRLDSRQLHRLSVADARVFKRSGRKVGINAAVHILLDYSGSMRRRIKLTTQVCHAVAYCPGRHRRHQRGRDGLSGRHPDRRRQWE
ncbi:hypothetical protein [Pseudodesulfovibrio piezophilus]|uniref:hypothetical protein n=1 Tax=Pseudodesulfovibrio piezophilus TaxID=879567 RepID=UPI0012FEAC91|nr:hypothetical protein [Pseudodesulfovibrio piezophilus]